MTSYKLNIKGYIHNKVTRLISIVVPENIQNGLAFL